MLKIHLDNGRGYIHADGDLRTIAADYATAIHRTFNMIHKNEPKAAHAFKTAIQAVISDPSAGVFSIASLDGDGFAIVSPTVDQK